MQFSAGDLVVTTRKKPTPTEESDAQALATRHRLPFVARDGRSIAHHLRATGRKAALVVKSNAIHLVTEEARLGFHPNMAARRIAGRGVQGDHYLRVAGIGPGDHVLDCTCGMGADAISAAHAVGPTGRVVALEAAPVLAEIVAKGMAGYQTGSPDLSDAMRRVEVIAAHAADYLRDQPDNSFDAVAFDPMFAWPPDGAHGLDLVRAFAVDTVPDAQTLAHAARVARRCVVMADGAPGPRLTDLGVPIVSNERRRWWGRIEAKS